MHACQCESCGDKCTFFPSFEQTLSDSGSCWQEQITIFDLVVEGSLTEVHCFCCQVAAAHNLMENTRKTVEGRAKLGIEAFAQALLGIPKILAENSGYDAQETIIKLQVVQLLSVILCHTGIC